MNNLTKSIITKQIHLVQTEIWNKFKTNYGTKIEKFEDIYILVKKIPFLSLKMGYSPKVNFNVQKVNFENLKKFAKQNNFAFIRFDVPNVLTLQKESTENLLQKHCKKAPRNTFTKKNIYLNLNLEEAELMAKMHQKKRYNIKQAKRRGVVVKIRQTPQAFENFWQLHVLTANNQGFLIHPKDYFKLVYKTFEKNVFFVQGYVKNEIASCWMIIFEGKTIYYIYGGSNPKFNNYYPNDLVGFEAIKLGKKLGAAVFDMWGAEEGKGFTDFKLKYGAELVEYIDSYDLVINRVGYYWFNFIYESFWKLVVFKRKIIG